MSADATADCHGQCHNIWLNNMGILQVTQTCTIEDDRKLLETYTIHSFSKVVAYYKPMSKSGFPTATSASLPFGKENHV